MSSDIPIVMIAALSTNRVIGYREKLPWRIKEDLLRFKSLTWDNPVIMGRKTWASLAYNPLPQRLNIILSASLPPTPPNHALAFACPVVVNSKEQALAVATAYTKSTLSNPDPKICIIGGESIYRLFLDMATTLHLTEIQCADVVGDTYFPEIFPHDWSLVHTVYNAGSAVSGHSGSAYSFVEYQRVIRPILFKDHTPAAVESKRDIAIAELVTNDMRKAAIAYWESIHPNKQLIPIGDIDGIIYAALSASPNFRTPTS